MNIKKSWEKIQKEKPLILNLTNTVVQNWTANVLLSLGASPVMSNDTSDALELLKVSSAVNINIGTFDALFLERAAACMEARTCPCIFDPVGAGATPQRTQAALSLLPNTSILRGNAGEVCALQGHSSTLRGVDSLSDTTQIDPQLFRQQYPSLLVAVSGTEDLIFNEKFHTTIPFGVPLMTQITGMGCALSALIAAFTAVEEDLFHACIEACAFYALCGEIAYKTAPTPGSFAPTFLDTLFAPDWNIISKRQQEITINKDI